MEKILKELRNLKDAINYIEKECNGQYVINQQDKELLAETIKLLKKNNIKSLKCTFPEIGIDKICLKCG